jgi:hypothetical protein
MQPVFVVLIIDEVPGIQSRCVDLQNDHLVLKAELGVAGPCLRGIGIVGQINRPVP